MRYRITNRKDIASENLLKNLEKIIEKQALKLDRYLINHSKPVQLTVHISKNSRQQYTLAYSVNLKNSPVRCSSKGPDLEVLSGECFDKVARCLKKYRQRERKEHLHRQKLFDEKPREELISYLETHRKADKKGEFMSLLPNMLPYLEEFIQQQLALAVQNGRSDIQRIEVGEIIDELYIKVYDHFDEIALEHQKFDKWVQQLAAQLINEKINQNQLKRQRKDVCLEELRLKKYQELDESYIENVKGSPIREQELDDISYLQSDYHRQPDTMSYEEEDDWVAALDNNNGKMKKAKNTRGPAIKKAMALLPMLEQSVFGMYALKQLTPAQIARAKDLPLKEVDAILIRTRNRLKNTLSEWDLL